MLGLWMVVSIVMGGVSGRRTKDSWRGVTDGSVESASNAALATPMRGAEGAGCPTCAGLNQGCFARSPTDPPDDDLRFLWRLVAHPSTTATTTESTPWK